MKYLKVLCKFSVVVIIFMAILHPEVVLKNERVCWLLLGICVGLIDIGGQDE